MNNYSEIKLMQKDRMALEKFKRLLNEQLPGIVEEVILFGSKARGDDRPDSDIDILVIISKGDWHMQGVACGVATSILLEDEVIVSPKVINREQYNKMMERETFFIRNVTHEGVTV
jgi:predicted nucleotidyltransferase